MARNKTPKVLKTVPKTEEAATLTPEQQQIQALSQQLQAVRTELAVLKQMYAEVSIQARIALSEREQLMAQVQRDQQTIEKLVEEKTAAAAPPAAAGETGD